MDYFPSTPMIVDSNRILYTASPFARSSLLHLQEIGELKALQSHTSNRENLQSRSYATGDCPPWRPKFFVPLFLLSQA